MYARICRPEMYDNYHHGPITIYSRRGEDSGGLVITVDGPSVTVREGDAKEFPGRRDSLKIVLTPEDNRAPVLTLTIMQHKGDTLIELEDEAGNNLDIFNYLDS